MEVLEKMTSAILMVGSNKTKRKKRGKKNKKGSRYEPAASKALNPKGGVGKDDKCFTCGGLGHWSRNCAIYQKERKAKGSATSHPGIFVIEVNLSTSSSWILDTACGSHICTNVQGLRRSRALAEDEMDLRVGNGAKVAALSVGTYDLILPSGLVLSLDNCYYVPALSRNIISISCLDKFGYSFVIKGNCCSIYFNNLFYGIAYATSGLYVLNLQSPIYNLNTKRLKSVESNQTYLWHCRLGHINEKRISKLHKDGLLESFDLESIDTCEACLLGKMTTTPFTKVGERASDLLGLIH